MKYILLFTILFISTHIFAQHNRQRADSLLRVLPTIKQDTEKVKIYSTLCDLFYSLKPDSFFIYCNKGIGLATQLHMQYSLARFYGKLSGFLTDTGNYKMALQYAANALQIDQDIHSQAGIAEDYLSIGRVYDFQDDFVKSADYFFRALTIAQQLNDHAQIALIGTNLSAAYFNQGDYKKAQQYAVITMTEAQLAGRIGHVYKAYYLLGMIQSATGDTAAAEKYYDSAIQVCKKNNLPLSEAETLSDLAQIQKDNAKKISFLLQARAIYDTLSPVSFNSRVNWQYLGICYTDMYKAAPGHTEYLEQASKYLTKLIDKSREQADIGLVAEGLHRMAEVEALRGNYKLAYEYSNQYHATNDSLFSQDNKNKIAQLESREEVNKKNLEIDKQKLLVAAQKRNALLLLAGLLATGIIGFLFYRISAVRRRQNKVLTQLNSDLDNANKLKAKFFAILTHDLRSPVARLLSFLQLQKRNAQLMNVQQKAEQEKKITDAATSLLGSMEELLLWSKGQMDNFEPTKSAVPVSDLFMYIHDFFSTVPNTQFNFENVDGLMVYTDENFIKTIMHNLTQNAVKALQHTENAAITWKGHTEGNVVILSLLDNGPGIQQQQLKALYDDSSPIGSKYGLGLHIVRDLAKAIDCTITLENPPRGGAQFNLAVSAEI